MELKAAIIADDLTGANDSSVQFASRGMSVAVAVPGVDFAHIDAAEVLVVDSESRDIEPQAALEAVAATSAALYRLNPELLFYKKVDSTLRGNIGAELEGFFNSCQRELLIFAPAFIEGGRTTVNGTQFLHGKKLEDTELAHIPKSPVDCSYIPEIIAKQSQLPTALLKLETLRQGQEAVVKALQGYKDQGVAVVICDATEVEDLDLLAVASLELKSRGIALAYAGSAGLAKALSKLLSQREPQVVAPHAKKILLLAGSISATTRQQSNKLIEKRRTAFIKADPVLSIQDPVTAAAATAQQVKEALSTYDIVLVSGAPAEEDVKTSAKAGAAIGLNYFQTGERMAMFMANLMAHCAPLFDGFVLTGGDTAIHACQACGANLLQIITEVQAGIPLACIAQGSYQGKFLVTKAGAFGNADAFVEAVDLLTH